MSRDREREIVEAFVDLSNDLAGGYDVVELLQKLTSHCDALLEHNTAGLLLADRHGVLHLVAASSERSQHLEAFQLQRDEGPCLDCFRSGEPVVVPDLSAARMRWPQFHDAARQVGFASVHALPMRLRDSVLGTLGLFGDTPGRLPDEDLGLAQALAHVASVAIVNEKVASDGLMVTTQLQHALTSRIVIEQAKGVLAHVGSLDMEQAFTALRRYSRDTGQKLSEVAQRLVTRELAGQVVVDHARGLGVVP